jgi:hypothetical protein
MSGFPLCDTAGVGEHYRVRGYKYMMPLASIRKQIGLISQPLKFAPDEALYYRDC